MNPKMLLIYILLLSSTKIFSLPQAETGTVALSTFSEEKKKTFKTLREEARKQKYKYPSGYKNLITNMGATAEFKMDKIKINVIDSLKSKLPTEVVNRFKKIKYTSSVGYETITYNVRQGSTNVINIFGIAKKLNNNDLFYAYIKGKSYADPLQQYNQVKVKSCSKFLWWENCKDNIVPKERDFNANELNIIQQALISKFYEVLDTILDLDQNVILKAFKNIAHIVRKNPPSSRDIILDTKVSINLKTISINPSELSNKKYGLTQNCINYINAILQRNLYYTSFYDVINNQNEEKTIIFGVAMKSGSRLVISYIIGNAVADTYHFVCPLFSPIFREKMNIVPKRRYPAYYQSRCEAYNKGKDFRKLKEDYVNSLGNSELKVVSETMFAKISQFLDNFLKGINF